MQSARGRGERPDGNRPIRHLAFSGYLGGYRSQIEFNLDVPLDLSRVLEIMSHESYPGHHVEAVLKEQELYQARGHVEHSLDLLIAPQAVISKGFVVLKNAHTIAEKLTCTSCTRNILL